MSHDPVAVKVWGDFALFTRPELKAERVSYSVMPPSAARGVLEAIFWKPEFTWVIDSIHVLSPAPALFGSSSLRQGRHSLPEEESGKARPDYYQHFSILRNEVDKRATEAPISITESRTQRHSLMLRDAAYVIYADVQVKPGVDEHPAKYREQFNRRVERGACFARPYLGCRECACDFAPLDGTEEAQRFRHDEPVPLGLMLLDFRHSPDGSVPVFFMAQLEDGILQVGADLYRRHGL